MNKNYSLEKETYVPEIDSQAQYFTHTRTGARILSVINTDENKVFGISFRTPPENGNGVAHIMEHSVLCGSRKYPVKEPFVELMKGSLNTFLNAFTYPDKTCYPVASTNLQDFYNLVDVYLDAVFYPRITPEILSQEGWHYELTNPSEPLTYKGVVFNEMKGAYSSPDRAVYQYAKASLFPDNTYAVDSGGDPQEIPNLTYEYFKHFHDTYYHPSNAFIYFYGDDDPEKRLAILDEYLNDFERLEVDSGVPLQSRFSAPQKFSHPYFAGSEGDHSKKVIVTVNWLISDSLNMTDGLKYDLLDRVLLGKPAAPLWKALIDSGLGEDLSAFGFSGSIRQLYFSTGLKNIAEADADKVEDIIFTTLQNIVAEGIPAESIDAAMNRIEFALRENNTGSTPRGLSLMLRSLSTWLYDSDPIAPLGFETALQEVKSELASNKRLLEDMIERDFLNNTHRTTVVLVPDETLAEQLDKTEKERLAKTHSNMTDEEIQKIIEETSQLQQLQATPDTPEALATIPHLSLNDLERAHKSLPNAVEKWGATEILYHDLFTSGITYFDIGFNLRAVPQRLLPYVKLFGRALKELGTEKEDFVKLSERIDRNTGGISQYPMTYSKSGSADAKAWMFFSGKCMVAQTSKLFDILQDMLLIPKLDNQERFRQLVLDAKSSKESALASSGHSLVNSRLGACFSETGWLIEEIGGVSYLFFLRELAKKVDEDWPGVLADLEAFRSALINRNGAICNITVDETNWREIRPQLQSFLDQLPNAERGGEQWDPVIGNGFEGLVIPAQINFVGKAANIYDLGYKYHGSIVPILKYLRTNWLWNRVRVQGGAYGAFCRFNRHSGFMSFGSYRDPNLLETIKNYDETAAYLQNTEISKDELIKSIIGAFGDIDAYQLPDAKGHTAMMRYLYGDSDADYQKRRDEIFETTPEHFKQYGKVLERVKAEGIVVVAGGLDAIQKANEANGDWLRITKVM